MNRLRQLMVLTDPSVVSLGFFLPLLRVTMRQLQVLHRLVPLRRVLLGLVLQADSLRQAVVGVRAVVLHVVELREEAS